MSNLERRLSRLERMHGNGKSRIIAVSMPGSFQDDGPADGEVDAFLRKSGIRVTDRDLVITVLTCSNHGGPEKPVPSLLMVKDR